MTFDQYGHRKPVNTGCVCSQLSAKHHSPMPVKQNAMLAMPLDCSSQNLTFRISATCRQVINGITMVNAGHVLFDDRPLV
jgi:hypothetical protein